MLRLRLLLPPEAASTAARTTAVNVVIYYELDYINSYNKYDSTINSLQGLQLLINFDTLQVDVMQQ